VKSPLHNSGYQFPADRITGNLAPAHLKKEGSRFDLPIAIGILTAMGLVDQGRAAAMLLVGPPGAGKTMLAQRLPTILI
jgi:magnesium chelatase family protein